MASRRYYLAYIYIYIYINKIIQGFKTAIKKGIQINNRKLVNTKLYADDHILMATSEDGLKNNGTPLEPYSKTI